MKTDEWIPKFEFRPAAGCRTGQWRCFCCDRWTRKVLRSLWYVYFFLWEFIRMKSLAFSDRFEERRMLLMFLWLLFKSSFKLWNCDNYQWNTRDSNCCSLCSSHFFICDFYNVDHYLWVFILSFSFLFLLFLIAVWVSNSVFSSSLIYFSRLLTISEWVNINANIDIVIFLFYGFSQKQ